MKTTWVDAVTGTRILGLFAVGLAAAALTVTVVLPANAQSSQAIAVLVNDEPISQYDIDQRLRFVINSSSEPRKKLGAILKSSSIQDRWRAFIQRERPQSREEAKALQRKFVEQIKRQVFREFTKSPKLRKQVLDELIEERLKLQEAKRQNVVISEKELDDHLDKMAERNKVKATGKPMNRAQFTAMLKKQMGVNIKDFRNRIKAQLAWVQVVRRKFGPLIHVGDGQVDQILAGQDGGQGPKKAVLKLKKIRLAYAATASEKTRVGRLVEAEGLRIKFDGCANSAKLVKAIPDAKIQNLGTKESEALPQPLRGLLLGAKVGELTPPSLTSTGVELYAVCARNMVLANEKKRASVKSDLRQKEFAIMSKRLLRDIKQDAYIEHR